MNHSQSTIHILCISKFFNIGLFSWKQPILQHFLISLCLIFCSIKKTFFRKRRWRQFSVAMCESRSRNLAYDGSYPGPHQGASLLWTWNQSGSSRHGWFEVALENWLCLHTRNEVAWLNEIWTHLWNNRPSSVLISVCWLLSFVPLGNLREFILWFPSFP